MAVISEDVTKLAYGKYPGEKQIALPNHKEGAFVGNDTDDHDFVVDARGKAKCVVAVVNLSNKDLTVTMYGLHAADGVPGESPSFEIDGPGNGSFTVTAAANWGYEVLNDPFPWICARCTFEEEPDGGVVAIYFDFQHGG